MPGMRCRQSRRFESGWQVKPGSDSSTNNLRKETGRGSIPKEIHPYRPYESRLRPSYTEPALSEKKFEKMPPKKNFSTFYLLYNLKEEKMASASDFHFMLIKSESDADAIWITSQ